MITLSITEARENLADIGNRVSHNGERVVVTRRGKSLFAIVSVADLDLLNQLEDHLDIAAIKAARNQPSISWVKVKKALGL